MFVVPMTDARRNFRSANLTGRGPRRQRFFATLHFDLWTLNFSFALVNQALPFVTVVIPTRPVQAEIPALTVSRALDYPREKLELLVVRGRQPAVQRNAALKAARGELIYFLDDDSMPHPANLRRAASHFSNPEVPLVGGPNLCPPDAPNLEGVWPHVDDLRARTRGAVSVASHGRFALELAAAVVLRVALDVSSALLAHRLGRTGRAVRGVLSRHRGRFGLRSGPGHPNRLL